MENYEVLDVIGEGTYGVVLRAKQKATGRVVAIKKFKSHENKEHVRKIFLREFRMLKSLRHPNIVALLDTNRQGKQPFLVFEYVEENVLECLMQSKVGLPEDAVRRYMFQLLRALEYCHLNNIIHRDVKPENILISKSGALKLCDFGFARSITASAKYTDYVATRWYRAPELLVGDVHYTPAVDVWAVGCLLAELSDTQPLFPGTSDLDQLLLILQACGSLPKNLVSIFEANPLYRRVSFPKCHSHVSLKERYRCQPPEWIKFLLACLAPDPQCRPTCSQLLSLSYFTKDNFKAKYEKELASKGLMLGVGGTRRKSGAGAGRRGSLSPRKSGKKAKKVSRAEGNEASISKELSQDLGSISKESLSPRPPSLTMDSGILSSPVEVLNSLETPRVGSASFSNIASGRRSAGAGAVAEAPVAIPPPPTEEQLGKKTSEPLVPEEPTQPPSLSVPPITISSTNPCADPASCEEQSEQWSLSFGSPQTARSESISSSSHSVPATKSLLRSTGPDATVVETPSRQGELVHAMEELSSNGRPVDGLVDLPKETVAVISGSVPLSHTQRQNVSGATFTKGESVFEADHGLLGLELTGDGSPSSIGGAAGSFHSSIHTKVDSSIRRISYHPTQVSSLFGKSMSRASVSGAGNSTNNIPLVYHLSPDGQHPVMNPLGASGIGASSFRSSFTTIITPNTPESPVSLLVRNRLPKNSSSESLSIHPETPLRHTDSGVNPSKASPKYPSEPLTPPLPHQPGNSKIKKGSSSVLKTETGPSEMAAGAKQNPSEPMMNTLPLIQLTEERDTSRGGPTGDPGPGSSMRALPAVQSVAETPTRAPSRRVMNGSDSLSDLSPPPVVTSRPAGGVQAEIPPSGTRGDQKPGDGRLSDQSNALPSSGTVMTLRQPWRPTYRPSELHVTKRTQAAARSLAKEPPGPSVTPSTPSLQRTENDLVLGVLRCEMRPGPTHETELGSQLLDESSSVFSSTLNSKRNALDALNALREHANQYQHQNEFNASENLICSPKKAKKEAPMISTRGALPSSELSTPFLPLRVGGGRKPVLSIPLREPPLSRTNKQKKTTTTNKNALATPEVCSSGLSGLSLAGVNSFGQHSRASERSEVKVTHPRDSSKQKDRHLRATPPLPGVAPLPQNLHSFPLRSSQVAFAAGSEYLRKVEEQGERNSRSKGPRRPKETEHIESNSGLSKSLLHSRDIQYHDNPFMEKAIDRKKGTGRGGKYNSNTKALKKK